VPISEVRTSWLRRHGNFYLISPHKTSTPGPFDILAMQKPPFTTAALQDDNEEKKRNLRAAQKAEKHLKDQHSCDVDPFLDWLKHKKDFQHLLDLMCYSHNEPGPVNAFWNSFQFIQKHCELKEWKPHHTVGKNYGFIWLKFSRVSS
jgi:hypothetical protein